MAEPKKNIRALSEQELADLVLEKKQPRFRASQINDWMWKAGARSFDEMSNLPKGFRSELESEYDLFGIRLEEKQVSEDGTIKCTFRLFDGELIEGVLIPADGRMTACISSQVGCSLSCKFCATGFLPRKRNLFSGEIFDQVIFIDQLARQHYDQPLSNIVYMGMGEPLLNFKEVVDSTERITQASGLNWNPGRITVSTAGIAKMIKKLGDKEVKFNLALSLHATNDEKRSQVMPINDTNNMKVLLESLNHFYTKTRNRITFEYIALKDFNDGIEDAKELVDFARKVPSKVNVIEYNPVDGTPFERSDEKKLDRFIDYLRKEGITTMVRRSRGKDIDAACGQLAGKKKGA